MNECPANYPWNGRDWMQLAILEPGVSAIKPEFLKRYLDTPFDRQPAAASQVAVLPDAEIFSIAEEH